MKMTIDANIMLGMFKNCNRDYYTYEACEALIDFYDEIDDNTEFDVIAMCCEWNEYGKTPCLKWKDFISNYAYLMEDIEEFEEMTEEEKINTIIEELEDRTIVIRLSDSVLVAAF